MMRALVKDTDVDATQADFAEFLNYQGKRDEVEVIVDVSK